MLCSYLLQICFTSIDILWDNIQFVLYKAKAISFLKLRNMEVHINEMLCNVLIYLIFLTLLMLEMEYSGFRGQYHACWCTGSQSCQCISRHSIGCVGQMTCIVVPEFHQPWLVIRTFQRQGRCSRGGHLCNEHSEEKYSCSYKYNLTTDILIRFCVDKLFECILILMGLGERLWLLCNN